MYMYTINMNNTRYYTCKTRQNPIIRFTTERARLTINKFIIIMIKTCFPYNAHVDIVIIIIVSLLHRFSWLSIHYLVLGELPSPLNSSYNSLFPVNKYQ